jgi:hypothetical protein
VADYTSLHLAVLDNKSELRVLQGRLDEADALLEQAMQLAAEAPGLRNSWQYLAAVESRVRLLHLRGNASEASRLALAAEEDAERRSDHLLRHSYRLLRASILIDAGRVTEAASVLQNLVRHRHELARAQDLELDRLLGEYFAHQGETVQARDHVLRAARLQETFSSAITRLYLQRTAASIGIGPVSQYPREADDATARVPQEPPLDTVSLKAVEQLFHLSAIPELLGREVLSMLLRSGYVLDARIASSPVDQPPAGPQDPEDRIAIPLGAFLGRGYRVEARVRPGLAALESVVTIRSLVGSAVHLRALRQREMEKTSLWRFEPVSTGGAPLVVASSMQQVLINIQHLASSDVPVLLTGETGTGKEVFARELHRTSGAKGAFVPFNCTAVAKDMLGAQLFGYRRGAFTGAVENFAGTARSASDGTLFLDEIGELDLDLQPKLLRLLDASEVHPLGEPTPSSSGRAWWPPPTRI